MDTARRPSGAPAWPAAAQQARRAGVNYRPAGQSWPRRARAGGGVTAGARSGPRGRPAVAAHGVRAVSPLVPARGPSPVRTVP